MTPHEKVAENIRIEMTRQKKKNTLLSATIGRKMAAVYLKLKGDTPFTLDEVGKISTLLNVPFTTLLEGVDDLGTNES